MDRRWHLVLVVVLMSPTPVSGETRFSEGFRDIEWGTPKRDVDSSLSTTLGKPRSIGKSGKFRRYVDTLVTREVWITPLYHHDSLYLVMLSSSDPTRPKISVQADTKRIVTAMRERYGDPTSDSTYFNEAGSLEIWRVPHSSAVGKLASEEHTPCHT